MLQAALVTIFVLYGFMSAFAESEKRKTTAKKVKLKSFQKRYDYGGALTTVGLDVRCVSIECSLILIEMDPTRQPN